MWQYGQRNEHPEMNTVAATRPGQSSMPEGIQAAILGPGETVPVRDGALVLGTWQGIYLCEFDGPRRRTVSLKVLPG